MKHLKDFKLFESKESKHPSFPETEDEIHILCKEYKITNYTINEDLSIDVDGDVDLSFTNLNYLPLKFNKVGGYFSCSFNNLKSLKGCPSVVNDIFNCCDNNLESLKGCSSVVGGSFDCSSNNLESLKGCPNEIGGNFDFSINNIRSLNYFPIKIEGFISIFNNPIYSLIKSFIYTDNKDYLTKVFEDYGIISRDETTVYWNRYFELCDDYDIEMVNIDEVREYYKVIE